MKKTNFFETRYFQIFRRTLVKNRVAVKVDEMAQKYDLYLVRKLKDRELAVLILKYKRGFLDDIDTLINWIQDTYKLPDDRSLLFDMIAFSDARHLYSSEKIRNLPLLKVIQPNKQILRYTVLPEDKNYIKIAVSPYASLIDIRNFINNCWKEIETRSRNLVKDNYKKVRFSKNDDRNEMIYLMNLDKKENLEKYLKVNNKECLDMKFKYKDQVIIRLIEFIFGEKVSIEQVKTAIHQEKKKRLDIS